MLTAVPERASADDLTNDAIEREVIEHPAGRRHPSAKNE
jgi:hypothetical protein